MSNVIVDRTSIDVPYKYFTRVYFLDLPPPNHGNVGVPTPGMLAELGMLMPLPLRSPLEGRLDPDSLELVKLAASGILGNSAGISAGTFLEMVCIDISCLPPFLRETEREGESDPANDPLRSMETASSGRNIRSRLLNVDDAPLAGSRVVMRSSSVPGLRLPRVLMLKAPRTGFMDMLILPVGSIFRPLRVIL